MEKVTTAVEEKLGNVLGSDALEQHANVMRSLKKKIQPTAMFKRPRGTLRDFSDQPKEETTDPSEEKDDDALSVNMAALLVISIVTCDAIVSLPSSLKNSGWMGVFLVILCGVNSLCAGNLLGWCWNILQDVWPEYKEGSMIPYAEIGYRAVGLWMRNFVMVSQVVSQLTLAIGYLSNISKHIEGSSGGALKFCDMMVLTVFLIIPFTWFRAPKNFWFLAIVDVSSNLLYMIFLLAGLFIDKVSVGPVKYPEPTFSTLALSFGQLMFAYSGGGVYPTIQNDMKDPRLFPLALFSGFLVIYSFYVPVAILGYAAYGKGIKRDITMNLMANKSLRSIARLLQFLNLTQLATTLVIYLNPTFQIFEYLLEIPRRLGYKRCLLRSGLLFLIFLLAYALPLVLELAEIFAIIFVGLLTCIFPAIFYGCLIYKKKAKLNGRNPISKKHVIFLSGMILLGALGSFSSFYSAGRSLSERVEYFQWNCYSTSSINITFYD